MFKQSPSLRARIAASRVDGHYGVVFQPEIARVHAVALKLARGHVAVECNEPQFDEPCSICCAPLAASSEDQRERFECSKDEVTVFHEVGSRMMQRLFESDDMDQEGWFTVQPHQYRYRVEWSPGIRVSVEIREYLAIDVTWEV